MGYTHLMIIDRRREVVCGKHVSFEQNWISGQ